MLEFWLGEKTSLAVTNGPQNVLRHTQSSSCCAQSWMLSVINRHQSSVSCWQHVVMICLFARISQAPYIPTSPNFLWMLPVTSSQSSCQHSVHYIQPFLLMTSCFLIMGFVVEATQVVCKLKVTHQGAAHWVQTWHCTYTQMDSLWPAPDREWSLMSVTALLCHRYQIWIMFLLILILYIPEITVTECRTNSTDSVIMMQTCVL